MVTFGATRQLYTPISGAGSVYYRNKMPDTMALNLTVERQIHSNILASASYIGSLSRHLLTVRDANPGNPALCLSLSEPEDVAAGGPTCGPFQENLEFTRADGTVVNGTRGPFPNTIGTDAYYQNMGSANYNALQFTLKRTTGRFTWLGSYTYGKSMDLSSSIQEQVYPYDFHKEYAISAFDIKHNFVASYSYELPLEKIFSAANRLTEGWAISGITRFSTGLPVTFASFGINNFDLALHKTTKLTEGKSLEFRFETFNTFNHAQFYPNGSVDANINSPTFGRVLKAVPPRISQVALKLQF